MVEALQDALDAGEIRIPVIEVRFQDDELLQPVGRVTSLQAPHRIADAILRDSLLNGTRFPDSEEGMRLAQVGLHNATPIYELCPTALVFGMWDSTGPRGGLGAKFQRHRFHDTILAIGSVPLPVLEEHIARFIALRVGQRGQTGTRGTSAPSRPSHLWQAWC